MRSIVWLLLLITLGCSTSTWYLEEGGQWKRADCEQSDREYRLSNRQYHCHIVAVHPGEARGAHR